MRPRTIIITVALILVLGIGGRVLIRAAGLVPHEHEDLKHASALRIHYRTDGYSKMFTISDPAEVTDVLTALALSDATSKRNRHRFFNTGIPAQTDTSIEFVLPDGRTVQTQFVDYTQLSRSDRGPVQLKNKQFYEKLTARVAEREGRPISLLGSSR